MDKIIEKYGYVGATDDDESRLNEDLIKNKTRDLCVGLDASGLKNIMNLFKKKICTKEYTANVSRDTPGCCMARGTMQHICGMITICITEETISVEDCQECMFDLLLAVLPLGPGSSHIESLMPWLLGGVADIDVFLKTIKGEKLKRLVTAIKEHTCIPEKDMPLDDPSYKSILTDGLPQLCKYLIKGRKLYKNEKPLDEWPMFLDLYVFFLVHTADVPVVVHESLQTSIARMKDVFKDLNPYDGFPRNKVMKEHIKKIQNMVKSPDFPRGRQVKLLTEHSQKLCKVEGKQLDALWPDIFALYKLLFENEKTKDEKPLISSFLDVIGKMEDKEGKTDRNFDEWIAYVEECIKRDPEGDKTKNVIRQMLDQMGEDYDYTEGDTKKWYHLIRAIVAVPTEDMQWLVTKIIKHDNFKRVWFWKDNISEIKKFIQTVEKVPFPTAGGKDDFDLHNANSGDAIGEILKILKIKKVNHEVMEDIGRLTLTQMEKKSILIHRFIAKYIYEVTFQKTQRVIPELIVRFEPLITDVKYPWNHVACNRNGHRMLDYFLDAYKDGEEMPEKVGQVFIRIFMFCMKDGLELVNEDSGRLTLLGDLLSSPTQKFIEQICQKGKGDVCIPILQKILKFRNSEDDPLQEVCIEAFEAFGRNIPMAGVKLFGPVLDWYMEKHSGRVLQILGNIIDKCHTVLSQDTLEKFLESCKKDKKTYSTQLPIFQRIVSKVPQKFSQRMVDILMENYYSEKSVRMQVIMVLDTLSKKNTDVLVKHMKRLINEPISSDEKAYMNGILANVTNKHEKFKKPVFEYLIKELKSAKSDGDMYTSLASLQYWFAKYGPEMFESHIPWIKKRRDGENNMDMKAYLSSIIDQLEGKTVESIMEDIQNYQDFAEKLEQRMTDTEQAVGDLATRVDEHDENIQELEETVDTVTQRVDFAEKDIEETKVKVEEIDNKTMTNAPRWSRDLTKIMNPTDEHDWRLLAQRLGYNNDDIRAWASQHDPCMSVLSEWYATHKTREATYAVMTALQEMNRMDGAAIVENAMKASVDVVEDEEVEYASPPPIFLSYQWGHQDEVKLLRNHLQMAGYECWMDIGQMGGGDKLFEKIDNGIRGAKVIICCVSEKYAKSPNCNREVNLSVNLGKPMIPLLMEKMGWPPRGSMGPIFSEYLFVRFFQRAGEETNDDRIWPVAKFQEMLMQFNCYGIQPEESLIEPMYKNWWIPVQEVIVIDKDKKKASQSQAKQKEPTDEDKKSPDVFISYQWGKQKQIIVLYQRLTRLGLSCWMDIHQMGGGDSLYEKIDSGVRGCKVVLTCITQKYSLSANCRREVSLADALKKPIIPLLLEKMDWPPSGPMSMVFTSLLFINFYRDEEVQMKWIGPKCDELLEKIGEHVPLDVPEKDDKEAASKVLNKWSNTKKTVASPVSQKGQTGPGGPQPTEKKPTRGQQVKAVSASNADAESGSVRQKSAGPKPGSGPRTSGPKPGSGPRTSAGPKPGSGHKTDDGSNQGSARKTSVGSTLGSASSKSVGSKGSASNTSIRSKPGSGQSTSSPVRQVKQDTKPTPAQNGKQDTASKKDENRSPPSKAKQQENTGSSSCSVL